MILNNNRNIGRQETPIADFLNKNTKNLNANFHALPIHQVDRAPNGYNKYKKVFGRKYLSLETTVTGKIFDSFFYPCKAIKKSQEFASNAFGSNDTLFVTCGTTIANYIAIDALINKNSHVLLDRSAHQSLHFSINERRVKYDYFYTHDYCNKTDRKVIFLDELLEKIKKSEIENNPYDLIVLSASSYDGVIYNIYEIIKGIININPNIRFLIDEAWSSVFYFHPTLYKYTAGYASAKLKGKVNIVSTQSAHKSLMASRQGSFIHSYANSQITERLYKSRFKYHTTSPSYPILASLDLARAHMQCYGEKIINKALEYKFYLEHRLKTDHGLSMYKHEDNLPNIKNLTNGVCDIDPLKAHLNISHLDMTPSVLQEELYHKFGLYFNRYTKQSILINIHIGINKNNIDQLLKALVSIKESEDVRSNINFDSYIIPYPPGIPLYAPGEIVNHEQTMIAIKEKIDSGIHVFQV